MTHDSVTLDEWRKFFQASKEDIFDIVENAIRVAAKDYPQSFRSKRDSIAEALYSCTLTKHVCSDHHVELSGGSEERSKSGLDKESGVFEKKVSENISKVIINDGDDQVMVKQKQGNFQSAEALSDELEEEFRMIAEVLRIKEILQSKEVSEAMLLDSLRLLQLMNLSVDKLDTTKIGKTVNYLRKHHSKNISQLSTALIRSWKTMVNDHWSYTKKAIAEAADTSQPVKPPGVEEEPGLPSPPLDEGAFFLTQPTNLDLSKFFDGIDDDGNSLQSQELNKNLEIEVSTKNNWIDDQKLPEPRMKKQAGNGAKCQQKAENGSIQTRPVTKSKEEPKNMDLAKKNEATKRKLHENYKHIHDAKKRRTIQVMDLCDIPKQGVRENGRAKQFRHVCRLT